MKRKPADNQPRTNTVNQRVRSRAVEGRQLLRSGLLTPWQAYVFAVAVTAVALGLRVALAAQVRDRPTLMVFTVPIMLAAYVGGLRGGLLATVFSCFGAAYLFMPPIRSFWVQSAVDRWDLFFLMVAGLVISALNETIHRARHQARIAAGKHAEELRQVSEARYRTLFEHAPDGIVIADGTGCFLDANPSLCRMLGYARDELIGLHASKVVAPTEISHIAGALGAINSKLRHERQWQFRRKDGSMVAADVVATQMPDGNLMGVVRDTTERDRADARVHRLMDSNAQGVMFWNTSGQITDANDAFLRLVGWTRDEMHAGRLDWSKMTPPEYAHLDRRALEEIAATGSSTLTEKEFFRKDGSRVPVLYGAASFEDNAEEGVCFVLDRTESQQAKLAAALAAEEIRRLNTDLEERVVERTAQLKTVNNELGAFSYSVSHDLRAPLRSIDGFSQALLEDYMDKLDAEGQDHLRRIRGASQRMGHLIDDLLNLSRLARGEMTRQTVDVSVIATEIAAELRAGDPPRQTVFSIAEGLVAQADPQLLRIVLTNLLANAWKFTAKRPDALIEFGCALENGDKTFFVRDNGAGFDMAYAGKLFGAFQRLHAMNDFPGNGIGLATVRRVIGRHGGRVWADAKVDAGATFYFTLAPHAKGTALMTAA